MLMPVKNPSSSFEYKPGKYEMSKLFDFGRYSSRFCEKCDTKRITACPECSKPRKS